MIGKMDNRLTFYRPDKTDNGRGGMTYSGMIIISEQWGGVYELTADEAERYRKMWDEVTTRIVTRANSRITTATNIVDINGNHYKIDGITKPKRRGGYMTIYAKNVEPTTQTP